MIGTEDSIGRHRNRGSKRRTEGQDRRCAERDRLRFGSDSLRGGRQDGTRGRADGIVAMVDRMERVLVGKDRKEKHKNQGQGMPWMPADCQCKDQRH